MFMYMYTTVATLPRGKHPAKRSPKSQLKILHDVKKQHAQNNS